MPLLKQQSGEQENEPPKKRSMLLDLPCAPKRAPSSALPEINFLAPPEEEYSSNSSVSDQGKSVLSEVKEEACEEKGLSSESHPQQP